MAQLKVSGSRIERKVRDAGERVGDGGVGEEGKHVKRGEGNDGEQRAAGEPFELLALQRLLFAAVAQPEDAGSDEVEDGEVGVVDLVEPVLQATGGRPVEQRKVAQTDEGQAGQVEECA